LYWEPRRTSFGPGPNRAAELAALSDVRETEREDRMLHLIWSVVVGFIVGLIARAVMPGADAIGFLATTAVGIVGSVIGAHEAGSLDQRGGRSCAL